MVTLLGFHLFPDTNYKLAFCVILSTEMVQVCSWNPSLVEVKDAFILHNQFKDHFVYAPSQWETMLQCNVASHWLGAYTKWSLPIAIAMAADDLTWGAMAPVAMLFKPLMSCTLVGNEIVDHSDIVGAPSVRAAPTTSLFSTYYLASMDWAKTTARWDKKHLSLGIWYSL